MHAQVHCVQEVTGQVIGTVVTCNEANCDNMIPGQERGRMLVVM